MPKTQRKSPIGIGFQYSKNGQKLLDDKIKRITEGVFKAAESKAKSSAKNKESIEVSENHFHAAIDFVLKNDPKPYTYWLFRSLITFLGSVGGLVALEGYRILGKEPEKTAQIMMGGGFVIVILAIALDKLIERRI